MGGGNEFFFGSFFTRMGMRLFMRGDDWAAALLAAACHGRDDTHDD